MERKPFIPESLFELCWVSDPQIAPDGGRVAYVEHWVEEGERDGKRAPVYRTALFLSDGPETEPRRLTRSVNADDWMPRWAPDGRAIAFLSTRDGNKPHIFVLDLDGGEARQVTRPAELSEGVRQFDWHPHGVAFCFTSTGHKTDEERKADEERDERVYDGRPARARTPVYRRPLRGCRGRRPPATVDALGGTGQRAGMVSGWQCPALSRTQAAPGQRD